MCSVPLKSKKPGTENPISKLKHTAALAMAD